MAFGSDSDELRNEDVALRLNSVHRLATIALALGEERTRKELLPFLNDNNDDEDEVLLAVAEQLGGFVPLVGGPAHAFTLLVPLETLSTVEETVVREKAIASLNTVGTALPEASIVEHFVPLVKVGCSAFAVCFPRETHTWPLSQLLTLQRLATGEWFTSRVSAAGLFATAYAKATPALRAELRALFGALCHDDTPMVRRAAAQNLAKFAGVVGRPELEKDVVPLFHDLTQDGQSVVLSRAVDCSLGWGR